jgi:predicted alpha/beta superfamily hydrolase
MFDFYIAFDPSLWWNNKQLLKDAPNHLKSFPGAAKSFWFAGSSAKDIFENTSALSKVLASSTLPNLKWHYTPEKKEKHHTIFRATKEKALIWSLN